MNISYTNLFIEASKEVFKELGFTDLSFTSFKGDGYPSEIVANVGVTGDLQGYLMFYADIESAKKLVLCILDNMSMSSEEKGFSRFHKETIGEVVNQVSGRTVMFLSNENLDCSITPPTIITGDNITYDIRNLEETAWHKVTGVFGELVIFVGIKKTVKA